MKTVANALIRTKFKRQVGLLRSNGFKRYSIRKVKDRKLICKSWRIRRSLEKKQKRTFISQTFFLPMNYGLRALNL